MGCSAKTVGAGVSTFAFQAGTTKRLFPQLKCDVIKACIVVITLLSMPLQLFKRKKKQKPRLYKRLGASLSRMLGMSTLKRSHDYLGGMIRVMLSSVRANNDAAMSFNEAQVLYDLDEQDITAKYRLYRQHTAIYSLALFLMTGYLSLLSCIYQKAPPTTSLLAMVVLCLLILRARYFCYLIRRRQLDITFFQWMYRVVVRRAHS